MTETSTHPGASASDEERRDALADRLVDSFTASVELFTIELGRRLGFYPLLAAAGPVTVAEFADRAGIALRYGREWLEQQAAAGILDVVSGGSADERRYALPKAHVPVLVTETDPNYSMGWATILAGAAVPFDDVALAFRTGEGVAYHRYGPALRWGIAAMNRPGFEHDLPRWVEAIPGLGERLAAGGRILDAGCGEGWSSIALASAFPNATVHGVDMDAASIAEAARHAEGSGVAGRVSFTLANATGALPDTYDLACIFEALHDMGDPVGVLATIRQSIGANGVVLIGDEKVADEFTAPADPLDRMQYAISVLHCLPATMAESPLVANGTVLRAPTVASWSAEAGYSRFEVLPIEHDFWRFYALWR